jgi:hypothetical protein
MKNRVTEIENRNQELDNRQQPQSIGQVLAELLAQYQARFPEARIAIVETSAAAI